MSARLPRGCVAAARASLPTLQGEGEGAEGERREDERPPPDAVDEQHADDAADELPARDLTWTRPGRVRGVCWKGEGEGSPPPPPRGTGAESQMTNARSSSLTAPE